MKDGYPLFESERIAFRTLQDADLPLLHEWWCNPDVMLYEDREAIRPRLQSETDEMFRSWFKESPTMVSFCVALKPSKELIGVCLLMGISPRNRSAILAIMIGRKDLWGQGLGKEALGLLLGYGFRELNLNRIELHVMADNERGIRAYRAVGFREVGREREAWYRDGVWSDTVTMDILQREYFGR
jgi:RimJ/RimL family protein N-acetyltransferase